ncbi:cleavage stimulation factor subunit 77-like isoform X1 [Euphorbia lathyris]|uniref:cleavage stimulation factor subunit 77-like isoform X1 n=1 Tax=Euphorbia lathyris TaxID=212925 RepID=UPI003313E4C2
MYLYHYPDIWYDYATWHAKSGAIDAAIKVFQRALKALPGLGTPPDSEMLKFAYAELEESHGAIHPAKKIYESLLGDGVDATALAHIQAILHELLRRHRFGHGYRNGHWSIGFPKKWTPEYWSNRLCKVLPNQ